MKAVFNRELRMNAKSLIIWSLSVGLMGMFCILLYQSMEGEMKEMADAFSNMGAFSDAFGMSTLSIATLTGYFATEVGAVHGLGSAMFAAITAIGILSKEEEGHTGEFLLSLPLSRSRILLAKGLCVLTALVLFTLICSGFYGLGFLYLGEGLAVEDFMAYMLRCFCMNLEIAALCFCFSSLPGKNRTGQALAIALICYFYDVILRVVPDGKDYLFIGPYSYANAAEIFTKEELSCAAILMGIGVSLFAIILAFMIYQKRDLAA